MTHFPVVWVLGVKHCFKNNATFSRRIWDRARDTSSSPPTGNAILAICDTPRTPWRPPGRHLAARHQTDPTPIARTPDPRKKAAGQESHDHGRGFISPEEQDQGVAMQVLDAVVKNCGKPVHDEVITMSFHGGAQGYGQTRCVFQ
ncbi:hypothetical protein BV898_17240 [Hypsibius exemplaris]|uniref:VHS domain-containing protein n=1 Tax=Hypsibius exemplaris TaxID=2072580 RepID=A0A9X6NEP1_HYPEX|nr:hypothetical protein BV898_17240 [Hypsibius exemplaris]